MRMVSCALAQERDHTKLFNTRLLKLFPNFHFITLISLRALHGLLFDEVMDISSLTIPTAMEKDLHNNSKYV